MEEQPPTNVNIFLYILGFIIITLIFIIGIVSITRETVNPNDNFWSIDYRCTEVDTVFPLTEEQYNCELNFCQRRYFLGTDIDKCICKNDNSTVYRYCTEKTPVYGYEGDINESNFVNPFNVIN